MASLALSPLERDVRIAAAEMLVALCEALPSMCLKLPGFVERVLDMLLAFAVRSTDDLTRPPTPTLTPTLTQPQPQPQP